MTGKALNRAAAERQHHKAKKRRKKANKAVKKAQEATGKQTTRLQFSEAERSDPELAKYVKKSEKAADRLEAAREKIPKQKRIKAAREFDEATGRAKTRLYFEKTDKPPNGKLHHNPADRPVREIKNYVHGKVSEVEKDNSGVEGAHKSEKVAEWAGSYASRKLKEGYRSHKLKPYRKAAKAETASQKADTNYLYHKTLKENPELASNPLSRFHQKQQIKKQYTKDLRAAQKAGATAGKTAGAAKNTRKATQKAGEATKKTTDFIARHWKGILTVGVFLLLIVMIFTGLSSCAAVIQGGVTSIVGTSYTAEDETIREVEADYKELESELREEIADIETDYPDYDEYQYHLDEIGHNPFALASYLTAKLYDYTREEARAEIQALFEKQWESIVGNCDELLYLGGNEQSTHEYVSKLLGKETIDMNTYGQSRGRNGNYSTNWQITGRELMTPDEVRMLDNKYALLFIRGERPVMDFKYDILRHPNVSRTADGKADPYKHGKEVISLATVQFDEDLLSVKHNDGDIETGDFVILTEEEIDGRLEEITARIREAPNFAELETALKECGTTCEQYLQDRRELYRISLAEEKLYAAAYEEFRLGNDRIGDRVCGDFTEYWTYYLLDVVYPAMESYNETTLEPLLKEAEVFYIGG